MQATDRPSTPPDGEFEPTDDGRWRKPVDLPNSRRSVKKETTGSVDRKRCAVLIHTRPSSFEHPLFGGMRSENKLPCLGYCCRHWPLSHAPGLPKRDIQNELLLDSTALRFCILVLLPFSELSVLIPATTRPACDGCSMHVSRLQNAPSTTHDRIHRTLGQETSLAASSTAEQFT